MSQGDENIIFDPTGRQKSHAEIGLFPKENGVGTVFSEFSGLRMRDGTPAQPCASGTYASWNARVSRGAVGARKSAAGYRATGSPAAEADTQATLASRDFVCPRRLRQAGEKPT